MKKGELERMSSAERLELGKLVRLRAKIARADIDQMVARQLAHVEQQLAAKYSANHERWAAITKNAEELVTKADAQVAKQCREMGIPESFRPKLELEWYARGENADKNRRNELRRVAETELEARAKTAKVEVDRNEARVLTQITADSLTSTTAQEFLRSMPSIDELMPTLSLKELEE